MYEKRYEEVLLRFVPLHDRNTTLPNIVQSYVTKRQHSKSRHQRENKEQWTQQFGNIITDPTSNCAESL